MNFNKYSRSALSGASVSIVNILGLLVSYPIFLKLLGVEVYGLWTAIATIMMFGQMGELGISRAIIKYTSENWNANKLDDLNSYFINSLVIISISGLLFYLTLEIFNDDIILILNLDEKYYSIAEKMIPLTGPLLYFILLNITLRGALIGVGQAEKANYTMSFGILLKVVFSVLLVYSNMGIWSLYIGWFISNLIVIGMLALSLKKANVGFISRIEISRIKEILTFCSYLFGQSIVNMAFVQLINIAITRYIGLSQLTYFSISWRIWSNLRNVLNKAIESSLFVMSSHISYDLKSKINFKVGLTQLKQLQKKGLLYNILSFFIIALIIFSVGDSLLKVWLKEEYNYDILLYAKQLSIGFMFSLVSLPYMYALIAIGKTNYPFYTTTIRLVTFTIIIATFISSLTISKLILSINLGFIVSTLFLVISNYRYLSKLSIKNDNLI